jgi:hypothetical protein
VLLVVPDEFKHRAAFDVHEALPPAAIASDANHAIN